jgi:uncharacterized membrane protein YfcA
VPNILAIVVLFVFFEGFSFLAQGRLVYFSSCSKWYIIGMTLFTLLYGATVAFTYFYTKKKMQHYRRINYQYDYPLEKPKYYGLICLGAFLGGFNGGLFALGNSTTMIFTLVYLEVEPLVVSATVGFQVVFAAAASLAEALINGKIPVSVVIFFFLLTFVAGGILSFISNYFISKLNRAKVNKIMVGIVGCLTSVSALSMVFNIFLSYSSFGSHYMIAVDDFCS